MDDRLLKEIRNIVENWKAGQSVFPKLCSVINLHLLRADHVSFNASSEALFTVLYMGLFQENAHGCVQTVCRYFITRWFGECEGNYLSSYIQVDKAKQISSYGASVLLYNHFFPHFEMSELKEILQWTDCPAPLWLKQSLSSNELPFYNVNVVLLASLSFKVSGSAILSSNNTCDDFMKYFINFLNACGMYQNGNYEESLKFLVDYRPGNCSFLSGWVCLMAGLNLEHLGRPSAAILKYKESLNYNSNCLQALYLSSRLFGKLESTHHQLQSLNLLKEAEVEKWNEDFCIQSILMNYHQPVEMDLCLRALWLLSSTCLSLQNLEEAKGHYVTLKARYKNYHDEFDENVNARSLLLKEDRVPPLPSQQCITLEYVLTLMWLKEYEDVEITFSNSVIDVTLENFEEARNMDKLNKVAGLMLEVLKADFSYQRFKFLDSLSICGRLLIKMESISGNPANLWMAHLLLIKAYLYKLLSDLNSRNGCKENKIHFLRLHQQCYNIDVQLSRNEAKLDECCKRILENLSMYIKAKCK